SGAGQPGGNAVDDFDWDAASAQPVGFFTAATKNARIAALQAHHTLVLPGVAQHEPVNERLGCRATAAALAHRDHTGIGAVLQYRRVDQIINHHDVGVLQRLHRLECE